jgi:hypothetical protein
MVRVLPRFYDGRDRKRVGGGPSTDDALISCFAKGSHTVSDVQKLIFGVPDHMLLNVW